MLLPVIYVGLITANSSSYSGQNRLSQSARGEEGSGGEEWDKEGRKVRQKEGTGNVGEKRQKEEDSEHTFFLIPT